MKTTLTYENQDSAPDYAKNEDPAKMTYSIPDFVSRNTTQNQELFPVLESTSPRSKIERCESRILPCLIDRTVSMGREGALNCILPTEGC